MILQPAVCQKGRVYGLTEENSLSLLECHGWVRQGLGFFRGTFLFFFFQMGPIDGLEKLVCLWDPKRIPLCPQGVQRGATSLFPHRKDPARNGWSVSSLIHAMKRKRTYFTFIQKKEGKEILRKAWERERRLFILLLDPFCLRR